MLNIPAISDLHSCKSHTAETPRLTTPRRTLRHVRARDDARSD
jgi:hypothetical protein